MSGKLRVTAMLMAAMAAGYVGGLMSQANTRALAEGGTPITSDVVRAKRFELVDSTDKVHGALCITIKGGPALRLYDTAGNTRAVLHVFEGEPALRLFDSAGKVRGEFSTLDGDPTLALYDSASKPRGTFFISGGRARLGLYEAGGKPTWSAP